MYVSSYFCCRIRPEGPLDDAERDMLAIAKFLVVSAKMNSIASVSKLIEQL